MFRTNRMLRARSEVAVTHGVLLRSRLTVRTSWVSEVAVTHRVLLRMWLAVWTGFRSEVAVTHRNLLRI